MWRIDGSWAAEADREGPDQKDLHSVRLSKADFPCTVGISESISNLR